MSVLCPCCGYDTLTAAGNYEVCPICCWEDLPPAGFGMRITSNRVTLLQAQRNFMAFGACEEEFRTIARPPTASEQRVLDWQPLDQRLRQQQQDLLDPYIRYRHTLLGHLAPLIDEGLLRSIAMADYGMDFEAHLAALRRIHAGDIPAPLEWVPGEVLALVRWSDPDQPNSRWDKKGLGHEGHLQRAFACTALLLAAAIPENRSLLVDTEHQTVICLIASLLTLDEAMQRAGLRLLSERLRGLDLEDNDRPFFALGILLLAAALPDQEVATLNALGDWVMQEEACLRDKLTCFAPWQRLTDQWLLGLTTFNMRHDLWQRVTVQVLAAALSTASPQNTTPLRTIIRRITGET